MIQDRLDVQLDRVADRYRRLRYWYALAAAWPIASVVVLILVSGGLRFDIRHFSVTSTANLVVICLSAVGIVFSLVQSLVRGPGRLTVARRIEQNFPDLDSALLAAIEQAPSLSDGRYGFLQQAVIEQALDHAQTHPWTQVVSRTRIAMAATLQFAMLGLFCACTLLLFIPAKPSLAKKAEKRPAIQTGEFAVSIEPGNTEIEKGTSLLVLARVQGPLPAEATLIYGTSTGEPTRLAMSPSLDDPVYGGRVPVVNQPLEYHVKLDDHLTATYHVNVFEYPRMERADARLVYPSYTGLEQRLIQDIRNLSVVEGTEVTLICHLNKPVKSARFIENSATTTGKATRETQAPAGKNTTAAGKTPGALDDTLPDLPLTLRDGNVYEVKFQATKTRRLKLELIDDAERRNAEQALIVIQVVPNQPPSFKLAFPGRDLEVSPLEELNVNATAWDDYGIPRTGISFGLAGQPVTDIVLGENVAARQRHELANVIRFEDLHAEPDQLLAYHFWAEDFDANGQLRKTASDMYFAEVRHFDEIFREGQQPAGGQQRQQQAGNQNTQAAQQLAQLQKDIINATWTLIRRETGAAPSPPFVEDVKQIWQSQTDALEQASKLSESIQDVESQAHLLTVLESMQQASQHLKVAHEQPAIPELQPALSAEQSAYQALLKLRAREHQVVRQQQQSSSASSSQAGRSQQQRQQMEQLDLKDEEKRYEDQRLAQAQQEQPEDRETRQVLNRLRELARRQHDLNERLKDLQSALQEAKNEEKKEEIRQQLKRLQDEQRDVLRDTDELQSRMEAPENQERMAEERQQLEQARDQVQKASQSLEKDQVTQAAASGTRAEKEFDELRNEFRKRASGRFNEEMREMRDAARNLDQQEKELAEQLAATEPAEPKKKSLRDEDNQSGPIADRLNQQKERLGSLSERLKKTVEEAEQTEPLLTERLADAARNLQDQNVERALEAAGRSARQGLMDDAREVEKIAGRGISQLRQGIEKAAESVLGDETEALRRAREQLKDLSRELNQEIARNAPDEKLPAGNDREPGGTDDIKPSAQPGDRQGEVEPGRGSEQDPDGKRQAGRGTGTPRPGQEGAPQEGQIPQAPQGGERPERDQTNGQPGGRQPADGQRPGVQPGSEQGRGAGRPAGESEPMPGKQNAGEPGAAANGEPQEGDSQPGGAPMPGEQAAGQEQGPGGQPMLPGQRGGQPGRQPGQQPGQNPQRGGQRGSRGGQPGPNQAGLGEGNGFSAEAGGSEQAAPISGDDFLNWSDRLRDVEEMVDDPELRAEAARIRDQARSIRAELKRHSKEPNWKLVRARVAEPLVELSNRVAEELLRRNSKQAIVPLDRDPVPPKYSEKTRRYYERLGSGK